MRARRLLPLLLLATAFVPLASAQLDAPEACGPDDVVSIAYRIDHEDGTTEVAASLAAADLRMGDHLSATVTVGPDCAGVVVDLSSYTTNPEERSASSYHFEVAPVPEGGGAVSLGPILLPPCAFQVNLFLGQGPPVARIDAGAGGEGACEDGQFRCGVLEARAAEDGAVALSWRSVYGATSYEVRRAEGDGTMVAIATVEGGTTSYLDEDTRVGATYRYSVIALHGDLAAMDCEAIVAEVTAVPFFGAPLLGALALVGALGAYAWMRHR